MAWTKNNTRRRRNADIYRYLPPNPCLQVLYHLTFPIDPRSLCTLSAATPSTYFAISTCAVSWLHGRRTSAVVSRAEATLGRLVSERNLFRAQPSGRNCQHLAAAATPLHLEHRSTTKYNATAVIQRCRERVCIKRGA